MCILKLNNTIIKAVDRARRHCLWAKKDKENHNSLAAWEMVCRPKEKGGLGIINLETQNDALLMEHLYRFLNHEDTPWVKMTWQAYYQSCSPQVAGKVGSFWWRDVCKLITKFRGISTCKPGNGEDILFWKGRWCEDLLAEHYDRLYTFAIDPYVTLGAMLKCTEESDLLTHLAIPISEQAYSELLHLREIISELNSETAMQDISDHWAFSQGKGVFSSAGYHKFMFDGLQVSLIFKETVEEQMFT
jgi:hypothetical protein